ncbi:MAG: RNA polymerase sigma factor RpoD/SigA [Spirochaetota bacterium]
MSATVHPEKPQGAPVQSKESKSERSAKTAVPVKTAMPVSAATAKPDAAVKPAAAAKTPIPAAKQPLSAQVRSPAPVSKPSITVSTPAKPSAPPAAKPATVAQKDPVLPKDAKQEMPAVKALPGKDGKALPPVKTPKVKVVKPVVKKKPKKKRVRIGNTENNISLYIGDAKKERLITREEEVELVKLVKAGNMVARAKLIKANLRFVVSIAKKYQNSGILLEDLISEGNIGLVVAADRFDPEKGYHFISYAVWWIKQAILKAISEKSRLIRLPLNRANNLIEIEKKAKELSLRFGHEPTVEEIAKEVNIEKDEVHYLMNISKDHVSLEEQFSNADVEGNLLDIIEDKNIKPPEHDLIENDLHVALMDAMKGLTETEAKVIRSRYGLNGETPKTLKEIGETFSLTKERIRQIEKKALRKMRQPSRSKSLKDFVE